jgi:hypothetical protein
MKITTWILAATVLAACGTPSTPNQQPTTDSTQQTTSSVETNFGAKISSDGAKPIAELKTMMGDQKELPVKLEATVDAVCQKKGCWMDLKSAEGETMRVTFKDYSFFVPKDAAGKTAIVEGVAKIEETSVADLKEYAKDAGKTAAEIDAITTPKQELVFEASGVILK